MVRGGRSICRTTAVALLFRLGGLPNKIEPSYPSPPGCVAVHAALLPPPRSFEGEMDVGAYLSPSQGQGNTQCRYDGGVALGSKYTEVSVALPA